MSSRRRRWRRDLEPMAGQLGRYLGRPGGDEMDRLRHAWTQVVGEQAAAQSLPVRRSRAGVVTVACASAAWAQELDMFRDRWTRQLAAAVIDPPITDLRFVVGDHVMPVPPPTEDGVAVAPTGAEVAAAEANTPQITDERLRELLVRAQAGQTAVGRQKKGLQRAKKPGRTGRSG